MFTLRCTARLLSRLKMLPEATSRPPSTILGDWYANHVHVGRRQFVLAVGERTFLPVVILAAPTATVGQRLREAIVELLHALGIADTRIEAERALMSEIAYNKPNNRQVLGVLVEFTKLLPDWLADGSSPLAASLKLAGVPCSPLYKTHVMPEHATRAAFSGP